MVDLNLNFRRKEQNIVHVYLRWHLFFHNWSFPKFASGKLRSYLFQHFSIFYAPVHVIENLDPIENKHVGELFGSL